VTALLCLLAACFSPLDDPGGNGAAGSLQILVGGSGRTVNAELLSYRFEFRGPGGEVITRNLEPPATGLTLTVNPGRWTIHVDAYTPAGSFYAAGDAAVLVEPGKAAAVAVPMIRLSPLLDTVAAAEAWISEAVAIDPDAGTAGAPISLRMGLTLDAAGWAELLTAIDTVGRSVALDLSACARGGHSTGGGLYGGGTFDPGAANTGEPYIRSLVLPDTAASIKAGSVGSPTFQHFTELTSISGAGIAAVDNFAFYECDALTTVSFPAATSIGDYAFSECDALTTVSLPAATSIGDYAFSNTRLTTVNLPAATSIGVAAFSYCDALTTVSLPAAPSIGHQAFYDCDVLTTVSLPATTSIGVNAFSSCTSLTTVSFPKAETIGISAFLSCAFLTTVNFPAAVSIGDYAFLNCDTLTTVNIPAATSMGDSLFANCPSLTTVNLSSLTILNGQAFSGCTSLTTVSLPAVPPTLGGTDVFEGTAGGASTAITLRVPSGKAGDYMAAWGVAADTAAGENPATYGSGHNRIVIANANGSPAPQYGWTVTTIAGDGTQGFANGTGTAARFYRPFGITVDGAGNLYVADTDNHRIRKIDSGGNVTTFAGSTRGSNDGAGTAAQFDCPYGITVDGTGNLYVADTANHRIRKIDASGNVTTFAGSTRGSNDGAGTAAQFDCPYGITVDGTGNLYVADTSNHRIRKIDASGNVTTLAGSGAGWLDDTGTLAEFSEPKGIAVDGDGNLYVADTSNRRIRKITSAGIVTTLAGDGTANWLDGTGATARFNNPGGITIDGTGNLYVADTINRRIRKVTTPAGVVTTLAGDGTEAFADGTGAAARFNNPAGIAADGDGNLYVADTNNRRIRKIDASGNVTTIAGDGTTGWLDGPGAGARFGSLSGIAVDGAGNLYVADTGNNRIRKLTWGLVP
jgi:sugar lactone lactonase YvrE